MTQVVNLKYSQYDVYIGRPKRGQAWGFGNPFEIGKDGDRDLVIYKYEAWLVEDMDFDNKDATPERRNWILSNIHLLKGKRLGCFCKPKACHGDVLARLVSTL